ncbi:MAG: hypothetical protein NTV94_09085, partial [Planctomycetota bacterium]|nr:hypothetical protein [Planctomycetota bacterium]
MVRFVVACAGMALSSVALADVVGYDNMTSQPSASWQIPSGGGTPASTGNRFLGTPLNLGAGSSNTTITGFDTTMINNTGASITFQTVWQIALNYWVYNSWTPSATTSPAFASLAGAGSSALTFNAPSTLGANSFFFFTQNASPGPGLVPAASTLPGLAITPVTVSSTGPIGVVLNWSINRNDGAGFVQLGGLSQIIVGGATASAPVVGSNAFSAPNLGYYR